MEKWVLALLMISSVFAICGDEITEPGEACDGNNISLSCSDIPGYSGGQLTCRPDCSGYEVENCTPGQLITAATCEATDVQAAINSAAHGDIVIIPSGTCTYSTPGTHQSPIVIDKPIHLKGDGTTIIDNTGTGHNEVVIRIISDSVRISDIDFRGTSSGKGVITISGQNWRVDHCTFINLSGRGILSYGDSYGVADHNRFEQVSNGVTPFGRGDDSWNTPISLGTANAVYIEDSVWNNTLYVSDSGHDAYGGARYVHRYNRLINARIGHHGLDSGGYRGTHSFEIYSNHLSYPGMPGRDSWWATMHFRSGTGVVWNNTADENFNSFVALANYRSCCTSICGNWGRCDGSNPIDGNQDASGYPCSDQIGRSSDADNDGIQDLEPLYEWDNTLKSEDADLWVHHHGCDPPNEDDHVQEGRDYYNDLERPGYVPYPYPHPLTLVEAACSPLSITDLVDIIDDWRQGAKNINQVMQAIKLWKSGC